MNFRRVVTALAVLTLFAGLASAQFQNLAPISCTVSSSAPTVRSEGTTERVGDVLISCGNATTAPTTGSAVDRGELVIDFGRPITSRTIAHVANVGKPSEIVLMFDEPGSGGGPVTGYGQNAAIDVCTAVQSQGDQAAIVAANNLAVAGQACPATTLNVVNAVGSYWVLDNAGAQAKNVYQGAVGGETNFAVTANQVKFYNVPILPSGAGNLTHLFRVTNVRLTPGSTANITATLTPSTLASGGNAITGARWRYDFSPTTVPVATATTGLTTTVSAVSGVSLCAPTNLDPSQTQSKANLALLSFKENFAGSFKTRVLALGNAAGDAMGTGATQVKGSGSYTIVVGGNNVTLTTATSETGTIVAGVPNSGLASSGTRLKAVFTGLSANATYYVSTRPVVDFATPVTFPVGGAPGDASSVAWAVLQDAGTGATAPSEVAAYTPTAAPVTFANTGGVAGAGVPVVPVRRANDGTGTVVWEVTNTVPGTPQTYNFALYAVYSNTVNPPEVGNAATVKLGYAPTTANSGTASTWVPRFAAPSATAQNFFNVLPCQTSLLFPFVTSIAGFDTGIAIANTSTDPFNTPNSAGTCSLNFYGPNAPAAVSTGSVASGGTFVTLASSNATNFTGYMIAVCNFQYAHGFAFIADNVKNSAMGYLANVLQDTTRGSTLLGEALGQ